MLPKVAYYATTSALNSAKIIPGFPNYAPDFRNYAKKNDVDSVHIGAQQRHQIMMFFEEAVDVNLLVFYGSLSRLSAVQDCCSHL